MKKFQIALATLLLVTSCQVAPPTPAHTITFIGTAEIKAKPDIATFLVTARQEEKTVILAQQKMTDKANKALALFKEKGIKSDDITTNNYSTNPKYTYENQPCKKKVCPGAKVTLSGYEATQSISIKLRDLTKAGEILTGLANLDIAEVNGPSFAIESPDKYRSQAQELAITQAKSAAQLTAKNLGITLKRIVNFSEEPRQFEPRAVMMMAKGAPMFEASSSSMPQLESGEQKITSSVLVTYEIE